MFVRNSANGSGLQELRLNADGSIQPVAGSPFAINAQPVGIAGNYLLAESGTTMAAYSVDPSTGVPAKTSSDVPAGQSVAGNSNFVYAGTTNAIYGYAFSNGELTAFAGSPFEVTTPDPCGCATPSYNSLQVAQGYLFFANSADHAGSNLAAGKIQSDGSFTLTGFGGGSGGAASLLVTPNGKFVYESEDALNSIELFDFNLANGTAQDVGPTPATNLGVIDPSSTYFFTNDSTAIYTYHIDPQTGQLTSVGTMEDANATPQAVDPSGKYLLVLELPTYSSSSPTTTFQIGVFSIDTSSGTLTRVTTYSLGSSSSSYWAGGIVVGAFQ